METFGQRLVLARENQNLSQKELAEKLGITPTRLNYWEKDKREPAIAMIKTISQTLKVDPNFLIGLYESDPPKTKNSPGTDESAPGENIISLEDSNRLLDALGLTKDGADLSDEDLAFLAHIIGLLEAWFRKGH